MGHFFVCHQCNSVDSVDIAYPDGLPFDNHVHFCTFCQTGQWHGYFERLSYDEKNDYVVNRITNMGLES